MAFTPYPQYEIASGFVLSMLAGPLGIYFGKLWWMFYGYARYWKVKFEATGDAVAKTKMEAWLAAWAKPGLELVANYDTEHIAKGTPCPAPLTIIYAILADPVAGNTVTDQRLPADVNECFKAYTNNNLPVGLLPSTGLIFP